MRNANDIFRSVECFFADKKRLMVMLYVLGFTASGVNTLLLVNSITFDTLSKIVAILIVIVLEFGKGITFIEFRKRDKYSDGMRRFVATLWFVATCVSIFASMGWFYNSSNTAMSETVVNSDTYKQAKATEKRLNDELNIKRDLLKQAQQDKLNNTSNLANEKQDMSRKVDEYNATIKNTQAKIEAKNKELTEAINKNWYNTQDKVTKEIKQLQALLNTTIVARDKLTVEDTTLSYQESIDKLNTDINSLNNDLNNIDYTGNKSGEVMYTTGYTAIFQTIANWTHQRIEFVSFIVFLIITVLLELLICSLYYMSTQYGYGEYTPTPPSNKKPIPVREINEVKNESPVVVPFTAKEKEFGFALGQKNPETVFCPDFDENDVQQYKIHALENEKNGISPGKKAIAESLGMKHNKVRKIKKYLENTGFIKTEGNKTYLTK